ncbi:MAG: glycerophosphodiester phosphodiesterase [Terriglobales bacterium]
MSSPLRLGHRGARASRHIPENSLASFELCLQHGCDGFEFDVRLAGDGQGVICHDASAGGMKIAATASAKLSLPTLGEVLRLFAQRAFLDIELKVAGLEATTLSALENHPPQKGYVISSFLPEALMAVHKLDPAIPLGLLAETHGQLGCWREMALEWVIPRFDLADRSLIDQLHGGGKKVMVWTVNRADRMREFAEWGVDAMISDETELLVRTLRS